MVHNLADFSSFSETNANALVKEFDQAVVNAVAQKDVRAVRLSRPECSGRDV